MADPQPTALSASTIVVSVHGPAGVLDLVVPAGATSVDVAREYAAQSGMVGIPLLQTPLGELVRADRALADVGVESGDVLVVASGVRRPRATTDADAGARRTPEGPAVAALVTTVAAAAAAGLSAWYAARAADDLLRTLTVGVLMAAAVASTLPVGRHASYRVAVAPAFGAAAAFAALHEPGTHLLPTVVAVSALAAAVVAAVARTLGAEHDEALVVWMVSGVLVFGACAISPLLEWDPRVSWTLLLVVAVLAARFAPTLAVDVPDEALLDLERLAVTAWSARDRSTGRRGRLVVPRTAMSRLVASATRTVTASAAAILVVTAVATPLLLASADIDLDRIGARCLAFFGGAAILLAARSYRHAAARVLLRAAGLAAWLALAAFLVRDVSPGLVATVVVAAVLLGTATLAAAVATGRGWRSVWWSRRAEVAEAVSGSFALAAAVVAVGLFRVLWEMTS